MQSGLIFKFVEILIFIFFFWIVNAPILSKANVVEYTQFIDGFVKAFAPDIHENPELFDLVTTYQVHSYSKFCQKYNNEQC